MHNFEDVKNLSIWMIKLIGTNKSKVVDEENGADWDWVAAEVWNTYPGIVNEFMINDAIDFLLEVADYD